MVVPHTSVRLALRISSLGFHGMRLGLDGMLIGKAFTSKWEQSQRPCEDKLQFSNDPDGIWAGELQRFPGGGNQYPVQPGETVVLAFDAIDHSQHQSWMYDLSDADFEFRTQSDADNPAVPDLTDVGSRSAIGSGIQFGYGVDAPFLSTPQDLSGLPQGRPLSPLSDAIFVRIPAGDVVDIFDAITGNLTSQATICETSINANFSSLAYVWKRRGPDAHLWSQQRRPLGTAPGGWTILLDTDTNSIDFYEEMRTLDDIP